MEKMTLDRLIEKLQQIRTELGTGETPVVVSSLKHRYSDCTPVLQTGPSLPADDVLVEIVID